ncbi:MAG TPA: hypothetical protein PLX06_06855, partial [Fimbriimonadaceae bacterium]|nr:hypothetical protein [Fimbriimonadaceae bacterium]
FVAALSLLGTSFGQTPPAPSSQGRAIDIFEELKSTLAKAKSFQATFEVNMLGETERYTVRFLRKNYAKILSKSSAVFQNGKVFYDYSPLDNEYWQKPAPAEGLPAGTAFSLGGLVGFEGLGFPNEPKLEPIRVKTQKWEGKSVVALDLQSPTDPALKATLFLDSASKLPTGWTYTLRTYKSSGRIHDLKLNAPMKRSEFAWSPPKGAKRIATH